MVCDVVVKLKGYELSFRLEEIDFVPEDDFIPFIWKRRDDSSDRGHGRDDDGDGPDGSKRSKQGGSGTGSTPSTLSSDVPVPMQLAQQAIPAAAPPQVSPMQHQQVGA